MTYYRAYIVGEDGHFIEAVNLDCTDDAAAVESAKRLVISRDAEVWQQGRMVTKLATNDNDPFVRGGKPGLDARGRRSTASRGGIRREYRRDLEAIVS